MSGNRNYAWVVIVASDDQVESALISGKMLKITKTSLAVVALVSTSISTNAINVLNATFDAVVIRGTDNLHHSSKTLNGAMESDLLLMSAKSFGIHRKMIVVTPGVLITRQSDHFFDNEDDDEETTTFEGVCVLGMDEKGKYWRVIRIESGTKNFDSIEMMDYISDKLKEKNGQLVERCIEITSVANLYDFKSHVVFGFVNEVLAKEVLKSMNKVDNEVPRENLGIYFSKAEEDSKDSIAVVGMSCRFPEANNLDEYWDVLIKGKNTASVPPAHRQSLVKIEPEVKANFLKCPLDEFDAAFFGISPSEANFTDPQARLLLEVSFEAFENAAISPEALRGTKTGVFYGSWLQEYKEALNDNGGESPSHDFLRKHLGNAFGSSAAKLSYFYGFTGPNVSTESACSSSIVAIDIAMKSLQRRECPVALVCGANVILNTSKQTKVWAPDGKSKTFDAGADGYARSEGIAALILKRYSDAIRDQDNIHGVILGSATSQEGLSKSFGAPTVNSEYNAMSGALKAARVDPSEVDYVEAHATGTSVGDPIEAAAIVKAYSGRKKRSMPLWIGSGKTNMGHSESCSGLAGIIKVLLAMKHNIIPRHINVATVNPLVDFSRIPGAIPLNEVPWPRNSSRRRIAGVSSFGITGTDAHVIIQEPLYELNRKPTLLSSPLNPFTSHPHILTLSAKSEAALDQLTDLFRCHLETSLDPLKILLSLPTHVDPTIHFEERLLEQIKRNLF